MTAERFETARWWAVVGAIALAGLVLRVIAAQGGLWTDEAWSVVYAAQAGDPLGVFLRINHDNNHHLVSLWLQAVGPGAPPLLARAPAILAGTLCIPVAALLAGRRSPTAGLVAALLFAVAPILVVYGAEARGYALMLLAALVMLLLASDAVAGRAVNGAPCWLALAALLGMFSHLTMAAAIGITAAWVYLERRAALGPQAALPATLKLMGPALVTSAAVVLFIVIAAALSATGMRIGGYSAFTLDHYRGAMDDLALWTAGIGLPWRGLAPLLVGAAAAAIAWRSPAWLGARARLYALLILAVPVAVLLLRAGNTSFARYYLVAAIGLLLFLSEWIGRGFAGRAGVRAAAAILLVTLTGTSLYRDWQLIAAGRGRPAGALADMAALAPQGARIAFAEPRLQAVVAVAALRTGYPARLAKGCAPAEFLLAARNGPAPAPREVERCSIKMEAVGSSATIPLTGDSWVLYRAKSLQSPRSADSGRAPAAGNRRFPAERA